MLLALTLYKSIKTDTAKYEINTEIIIPNNRFIVVAADVLI